MNKFAHKTHQNTTNGNNFSQENNEAYQVSSKVYILQILREIMKKNTQVTLYFNQSNHFILTTILSIKTETDEILIDYGANQESNSLALKSTHLTFVSFLDKIRIEFTFQQIKTELFEDRNVFSIHLPESLIRLQRRKSYRLPLPITQSLTCVIPITHQEEIFEAHVTLVDISCDGIGMIDNHSTIEFKAGMIYQHCQINLPGIGNIKATIQIRGIYKLTSDNAQSDRRIGCQFMNLPATMETMIQRFITQQERSKLVP